LATQLSFASLLRIIIVDFFPLPFSTENWGRQPDLWRRDVQRWLPLILGKHKRRWQKCVR
jgi:hypothetical protein